MKKPNITPGEWRLAIYNYRAEVTNSGLPVANIQACHDVKWRENARLIAAAPKMAEALEELQAWLVSPDTRPLYIQWAQDKIRKALIAAGYTF